MTAVEDWHRWVKLLHDYETDLQTLAKVGNAAVRELEEELAALHMKLQAQESAAERIISDYRYKEGEMYSKLLELAPQKDASSCVSFRVFDKVRGERLHWQDRAEEAEEQLAALKARSCKLCIQWDTTNCKRWDRNKSGYFEPEIGECLLGVSDDLDYRTTCAAFYCSEWQAKA